MIKINLLGDEETTSADSIIWLAAFIGSVIIVIICCLAIGTLLSGTIADSSERIKVAEAQLARLREKTKEVDALKKTKDELQGMTLAIASLRKSQEGPVKLLDSLSVAVPENVWLVSVDSKVDIMKIEGLSLADTAISEFIKSFRTSDLVLEADLKDRRAVALVQINTFNSFTGEQTKSVIRGDKAAVQAKLGEIKAEAENTGLTYRNGIPESSLKEAASETNEAKGGVTKLSFESGNRRRFVGGRPTIYAWESLEEVKGISFIVEAKIRYSSVKVDIDDLLAPKDKVEKKPVKKANKEDQ